MLLDFNHQMELIEEIDKEADRIAKRRLDTIEIFLKIQESLSEIRPIIKSPWEIQEEKQKKQEKELIEQMARNSHFENYHLKKGLKNGIRNRKGTKLNHRS